jgi:2-polyprenyl-3-methyl-5-hydroxy-6-metoxy-1,4-benzoquinol methylase
VTESRPADGDAETLDTEPGYRLAAAGREAAEDERLTLLEQLYDPVSRRRRSLVQPGWRCLEVAAGRGSMAVWLAEQVGPAGHVVATDIDTRYLQRAELPTNVEVLEHDILEDSLEALGPGSFDLVCSRLALFHLVAGAGNQADGEVSAPRRLADRRGRRLGDSRSRRSRAPAL